MSPRNYTSQQVDYAAAPWDYRVLRAGAVVAEAPILHEGTGANVTRPHRA